MFVTRKTFNRLLDLVERQQSTLSTARQSLSHLEARLDHVSGKPQPDVAAFCGRGEVGEVTHILSRPSWERVACSCGWTGGADDHRNLATMVGYHLLVATDPEQEG